MPRLSQVPRSEATTPSVVAAYDRLFGPDRDPVAEPGTASGTPGNWWTVYALVPQILDHAVDGFRLYQSGGKLDPVLRELSQTRTGWYAGSSFVYSQHCKSLRSLGVSEDKIDAIPAWAASDLFTPVERMVLAYADALVGDRCRIADGLFDALKGHLGDQEILELTYITSMYIMHSTICRALRLEFDDIDERVREVAAPVGGAARDIVSDIAGE